MFVWFLAYGRGKSCCEKKFGVGFYCWPIAFGGNWFPAVLLCDPNITDLADEGLSW